jgi:hypothetical protein
LESIANEESNRARKRRRGITSEKISIGEKVSTDKSNQKRETTLYKYSNQTPLAEAILLKDFPLFLQIQDGIPTLSEKIETGDTVIVPPHRNEYLSKEYIFSSKEEIEAYTNRAARENLDSLFVKVKNIWKKYFDTDNFTLDLCTADTIMTYFQDMLGMTHYLLFVGDNSTGKSNALTILEHLGYRPLKDADISPANIYNFLGQSEEGQGIILEDEIDDIDMQSDKKKIYKAGYTTGTKVTRIYESGNSTQGNQKRFNSFCFKAFTSEKQPVFNNSKGFIERLIPVQCSAGNPDYDILEVINDAGDTKYQKLSRELDDLRKLLLVFRVLNHDKPIPDVTISLRNREKQLCKPLVRLFQDSKVLKDILSCLTKFIIDKRNKKLDSLDSVLYSIVSDLVKCSNGYKVPNEDLWTVMCTLPGSAIPNKPQCYQTEEFGILSKNRITRICEDKFGAKRIHDGKQRALMFDRNILTRFEENYSPIHRIEIIKKQGSDSFNSFNSFWKHIENQIDIQTKRLRIKTNQMSIDDDGKREKSLESFTFSSSIFQEKNSKDSDKVLEPLKVLNSDRSNDERISKSDYLLCFDSRKEKLDEQLEYDDLENDSTIGYKKPFYFCKEHPTIENIHYDEIIDHIKLSDLHEKKDLKENNNKRKGGK